MLDFVLCAVVGYLLGSLSFGIIVSKILFGKDIRDYGSNNAGMTNMLRTFGKGPGAVVFLGDFLKSVIAAVVSMFLLSGEQNIIICGYIGGVAAVVGHMFPLYFGFKGGKGAATALGVAMAMSPLAVPILAVPFAVTLLSSKMVSLASMITGVCFPIVTFFIYKYSSSLNSYISPVFPTAATAVIAVLVVVMHRSNIKRIIHGEERKIGKKNKTEEPEK